MDNNFQQTLTREQREFISRYQATLQKYPDYKDLSSTIAQQFVIWNQRGGNE